MKKAAEQPEELILRTSRIAFLSNYFIAILAIIFLVLLINVFDLKFNILPKNKSELYSTLGILGLAGISAGLIEQPEWIRFMRHYIITLNEVIEVEGILTKKSILPYQSI